MDTGYIHWETLHWWQVCIIDIFWSERYLASTVFSQIHRTLTVGLNSSPVSFFWNFLITLTLIFSQLFITEVIHVHGLTSELLIFLNFTSNSKLYLSIFFGLSFWSDYFLPLPWYLIYLILYNSCQKQIPTLPIQ